MEISEIKKRLIEACEKGDANIFKSAVYSEKFKCWSGDKKHEFEIFQITLENMLSYIEGGLHHKIRLPTPEDHFTGDDYTEVYEFFSTNYEYPRLSFHIIETRESVELNYVPF